MKSLHELEVRAQRAFAGDELLTSALERESRATRHHPEYGNALAQWLRFKETPRSGIAQLSHLLARFRGRARRRRLP